MLITYLYIEFKVNYLRVNYYYFNGGIFNDNNDELIFVFYFLSALEITIIDCLLWRKILF